MKHPQTTIKKFNDNTCLFICYLYCMGIEPDNLADWMRYYASALDKKLIDEEGAVLDGEKLLLHLTGKRYSIDKVKVDSLEGLTGPWPVKFHAKGFTPHWVVVENGEVVMDPIENSNSVKYGSPVDCRLIKLRK